MHQGARTPFAIGLLVVFVLCGLSACGMSSSTGIEIRDSWMKTPAMTGDMEIGGAGSVAYMQIRNHERQADRLLKVQTDIAQIVELHTMNEENGVMSMRQVDAIDVPAQGEVVLKPGGFHIMLFGIHSELKPGDKATFILQFERAGMIAVEAVVREP